MIVDDEGADAEHLDQLDVCSMDTSGGLLVIAQEAAAAALVLEATKKISASDDGASRAPSLSGGAGFDGMAVDAVEESSSEMQPLANQSAPLEQPLEPLMGAGPPGRAVRSSAERYENHSFLA